MFRPKYERLSLLWYTVLIWEILKYYMWQRLQWFSFLYAKRSFAIFGDILFKFLNISIATTRIFLWWIDTDPYLSNSSSAEDSFHTNFVIVASTIEYPYLAKAVKSHCKKELISNFNFERPIYGLTVPSAPSLLFAFLHKAAKLLTFIIDFTGILGTHDKEAFIGVSLHLII